LLEDLSLGARYPEFHVSSLHALASEVDRVQINRPIAPLHHAGDKFVSGSGAWHANQELPHGAAITG